ncbi:MAG: DUF4388 domain-containing protein [Thermoanaerobaculia bacterium]
MGISGNLKTMVLSELLQWLSMGQKTGTLVIDNKKIEKRVCFDKGVIISSASTDPKEYLGRFLVNHGFLADEPVNEAVARQQQEKQLLGRILVTMGLITEEDLHQMLQLKAEESIYDIFTWEEADFEFLDNELPEHNMVRMSLDVQWLVLEGSRRVDEWSRLKETIPSPQCVAVTVGEFDLSEVSEVDQRILGWVDDDRSLEDISQAAEIGLFQVATVLAVQVQAGVLKVVRPRIIEIEIPVEKPAEPVTGTIPVMQPIAVPAMQYPTGAMPVFTEQAPPPAAAQTPSGGVDVGGRQLHFAGSGPAAATSSSAATPPVSVAESLIELAESSLQAGDLDVALKNLRKARNAEGSNSAVEAAIERGETRIEASLARAGVSLNAVPKLLCGMEELTNLQISPGEGFLLTRLDGSYNIKSILKMSPAPRLDTLMLFWRLKKSGHVSV